MADNEIDMFRLYGQLVKENPVNVNPEFVFSEMGKCNNTNLDPFWMFKDSTLTVPQVSHSSSLIDGLHFEDFIISRGINFALSYGWYKLVDYSTERVSGFIKDEMLFYTCVEILEKSDTEPLVVISHVAFDLLYIIFRHAKHRAEEKTTRKGFVYKKHI